MNVDIENKLNETKKFINSFFKRKYPDKNAIIGISGGIDSAVVAVLLRQILGYERVFGFYMPNGISYDDDDYVDVKHLCDKFDISLDVINIKKIKDSIYDSVPFYFDKLSYDNLSAGIRMIMLYSFANASNGIVVGTTNKSELMIGYFTKYGDGGVDIEPIAHIYKTELYDIAEYLGIPDRIINKNPSAGLWKGQTDEDELGMSYKKIDYYLKEYNSSMKTNPLDDLIKSTSHKRKTPIMIDTYYD